MGAFESNLDPEHRYHTNIRLLIFGVSLEAPSKKFLELPARAEGVEEGAVAVDPAAALSELGIWASEPWSKFHRAMAWHNLI